MRKLKQSISVQRQIPDYISANYPYFVEFVKAYYEFLQQTQEKNLEGYRDIDTTLDEFLTRFKAELSENIPTHLAKDKRSLLRHIREFYLSRGSEASFKFLFKVLFEKEASVFYPSAQILRASDGRWIQDISIFVKVNDPNQTLFPLIGKFVTINTGSRLLEIYVSNVVEYKSDIYELSIQNDAANQFITVDSTVTYRESGIKYIGTVIKSPVKISIYKRGNGFKLGDIFSLKTDLGNGCVIKVTGVDSNGGLQAINVIKFGLDYETKFWSYLVPGQLEGFEYIQPSTVWENATILDSRKITSSSSEILPSGKSRVTITTSSPHNLSTRSLVTITITSTSGGFTGIESLLNGTHTIEVPSNSNNTFSYVIDANLAYSSTATYGFITKPYQEYSGGFLEYGYATKQNYLEYDSSISVTPNIGRESDRYYVDSSYVGDIVNQFYNEQVSKDPLQDYAILQVDVGAVAKYPGYYATSNGFISDECFIQDGYYYQLYSYVVRVEEEFRKYSDLVKNVLHPAGMKLFAEYGIFNEIDLQAIEQSARRSLQFSDSVQNVIDRGFSYSDYENTISFTGPGTVTTLNTDGFEQIKPLTIQVTPLSGSSIFNSSTGKPSLFPYKPIYNAYEFTQIAGRIASINEVENRQSQLSLNPSLLFPGHDVLESYHLEKNTSLTPSSGIIAADVTVIDQGLGYIDGQTYTLTFSDPTLSSGHTAIGTATWSGDEDGNGTWSISITDSGAGYILNPDNTPSATVTVQDPPGSAQVNFTALFQVSSLTNLSAGVPSSFIEASDIVFGNNNGNITSTATDLSIFRQGYQITIYNAHTFTNNGTYTVLSSSPNALTVEDKSFTFEDVAAAPVGEEYEVLITTVGAPFNDVEITSSSGYGYSQYVTTLDSLSNPIATPNTAIKVYTRNTTTTAQPSGTLWNAEKIDIYDTPSNYKSHGAYYMSINSSLRSQITVSAYASTGTQTVTASITNASNIFSVGDIIRIRGAVGTQQSNLNGTWTITGVSSNTVSFNVYSPLSTGIYSTNIGTAFTWRPNPNFTDYRFGSSSSFGYTSYVNSIDAIGNPITYALDHNGNPITNNTQFVSDLTQFSNKVYTRETTHDQSVNPYKDVSTAPTAYASHSSYSLSLNSWPRSNLVVNSYTTNGTTTITANVSSTSSIEVGDIIRISGIVGSPKSNLNGTWTITEKTSVSFKFIIYSPIATTSYNTSIGTAVVWRPNPDLSDAQQLESTGYSFDSYTDSLHNAITSTSNTVDSNGNISSSQELAYSGTVVIDDQGTLKNVVVYSSTVGENNATRIYSGNATRSVITDIGGNEYTQITGNTSDTSVLPHTTQRLNKVKVDSVGNSEDGRVVLNAYNEEAFWQNGYYSESEVNENHYEAHNSIPFDGNTYVFANKPA